MMFTTNTTPDLNAMSSKLPPMPLRNLKCAECGSDFETRRHGVFYCSRACTNAYNNRMKKRGAKLMPLMMKWRYSKPRDMKAYSQMCLLASVFHDEDLKAGRPSFVANDFYRLRRF